MLNDVKEQKLINRNKKSQQENRNYIKPPKEILELKNTIFKIKMLLEELNSRMEMTEERVNKLEDTLIEIIQS